MNKRFWINVLSFGGMALGFAGTILSSMSSEKSMQLKVDEQKEEIVADVLKELATKKGES